jgi:serine palmitoyltransferase
MSRVRFCISAGHTREDLDESLEKIEEVATILSMKYAKSRFG